MQKFDKKEYSKKYQQTEKYKQYTKNLYLDKVKDEYRGKTCEFLHILHKKTGKPVKNEVEILLKIDNSKDTKEVKEIYDDLIHLIKISK